MALSINGSKWPQYVLIYIRSLLLGLIVPFAIVASADEHTLISSLPDLLATHDKASNSRIEQPWQYQFPRDFYAHPDQPADTWQLLATAKSPEGARFAVSLRMVRVTLNAPAPADSDHSDWSFDQLFGVTAGLVDQTVSAAWSDASLSRATLGLAGSESDSGRTWVKGQSIRITNTVSCVINADVSLTIAGSPLTLELDATRCPVLAESSSLASIYGFSMPLVLDKGNIGTQILESGQAWLLRNWGEIPLAQSPLLVDQFHILLKGNVLLQVLRTRRRDGSGVPILSAVLHKDGHQKTLDHRGLALDDTGLWQSASSGKQYTAGWTLAWPGYIAQLEPTVAEQEVDLFGQQRWSGAVRVIVDALEVDTEENNAGGSGQYTGFVELDPQPVPVP